jgi:predicted RND superfamily exporter protein
MSEEVSQVMFNEMVTKDTQWAVFSILFVFIYFIIHLQSVFLAAMGILMILFSFPVTAVINEGIIRNTYYSSLHTLVIFIVLGIAADDIFVFVDAWRQSENIKLIRNDIRMRLAYSFRRAARATATTSSTTSVAFLANAFSPIMPIASFGIYAAVIITVNYALIIMVFPPLIIWYENCLKERYCPYMKKYTEDKVIDISDDTLEEGRLEQFFGGNWNNMVKTYRYLIVALFLIWTAVAGIFASKLTPLSQEEKFLPESHQIEVIGRIVANEYEGGGIINLDIDVIWGVGGIDKSTVNKWDPSYIGEVIMDSDFDLSPKEAQ